MRFRVKLPLEWLTDSRTTPWQQTEYHSGKAHCTMNPHLNETYRAIHTRIRDIATSFGRPW
jgi:hypothetical protein